MSGSLGVSLFIDFIQLHRKRNLLDFIIERFGHLQVRFWPENDASCSLLLCLTRRLTLITELILLFFSKRLLEFALRVVTNQSLRDQRCEGSSGARAKAKV